MWCVYRRRVKPVARAHGDNTKQVMSDDAMEITLSDAKNPQLWLLIDTREQTEEIGIMVSSFGKRNTHRG